MIIIYSCITRSICGFVSVLLAVWDIFTGLCTLSVQFSVNSCMNRKIWRCPPYYVSRHVYSRLTPYFLVKSYNGSAAKFNQGWLPNFLCEDLWYVSRQLCLKSNPRLLWKVYVIWPPPIVSEVFPTTFMRSLRNMQAAKCVRSLPHAFYEKFT